MDLGLTAETDKSKDDEVEPRTAAKPAEVGSNAGEEISTTPPLGTPRKSSEGRVGEPLSPNEEQGSATDSQDTFTDPPKDNGRDFLSTPLGSNAPDASQISEKSSPGIGLPEIKALLAKYMAMECN